MKSMINRPYRKNMTNIGVLTFGGAEYAFLVLNISTTGILAKLLGETDVSKFNAMRSVTSPLTAQIELPEMSFTCVCEIIRVEKSDQALLLALRFDEESMNVEGTFDKHNSENKHLNSAGQMIVKEDNYPCRTLYLSDQTLIVFSTENLSLEANQEAIFKFEDMEETVKANISWIDYSVMAGTLMGLNCIRFRISG